VSPSFDQGFYPIWVLLDKREDFLAVSFPKVIRRLGVDCLISIGGAVVIENTIISMWCLAKRRTSEWQRLHPFAL
jgi:hypothetical protein